MAAMLGSEENYGKYSIVSEVTSYDPRERVRPKKPKYYTPLSTRIPALLLILIAVLACIGALEYGLRKGLTVQEKKLQQSNGRIKRQVAGTSSSVASEATTSSSTASTTVSVSTLSPASTSYIMTATTPVQTSPSTTGYTMPVTPQGVTTSQTSNAYIAEGTTPTIVSDTTGYITPVTSKEVTSSQTSNAYITQSTTSKFVSVTNAYITPVASKGATSSQTSNSYISPTAVLTESTTGYIAPVTTKGSSHTAVASTTITTAYIAPSTTADITKGTTAATSTGYITPVTSKDPNPGTTTKSSLLGQPTNPSASTAKQPTSNETPPPTMLMTSSTAPYNGQTTSFIEPTSTENYGPASGSLTSTERMEPSSSSKMPIPYTSLSSNAATYPYTVHTTPMSSKTGSSELSSLSEQNSFTIMSNTYGLVKSVMGSSSTIKSTPVISDSGLVTSVVTFTTEDGSGNDFTMVTTATFEVSTRQQEVYDSTGGISTIVETVTSYSGTPTTAVFAQNTAVPTVPPDYQRDDEVELGLAVRNIQYFLATDLPVVVAVILKLIWTIVFASTKMMEPFYLLARRGGASAKESLLADNSTTSLSFDSIKTIFFGHPMIILATLVYASLSILPAIATKSTTVRAIGWCRDSNFDLQRCNPLWYLEVDYARALEVILSVVAIMIFAMIIISVRRRSGVFQNPSTIATAAALLGNEEFMYDLRSLDQRMKRASSAIVLSPYRYTLGDYRTASGTVRYGIFKIQDHFETTNIKFRYQQGYPAVEQPSSVRPSECNLKRTFPTRSLTDIIFLFAVLGLLGVLVAYYMDGKDDPFNNFFNHNSNSRLVLTCAASLIDIRLKQLEREVRLMTPYRRLFRGAAKPASTILVSQNSTPLTSIFQAVWRGNFFHAFVAFAAILADVLIITVGGVPFNSAEIWLDFLVSIYLSWAILGLVVIAVVAMFRWRALNAKMMMPREPTTLLSVLLMLCNEDNQLRQEMQGYETMGPRQRDERIKMRGGLYWAGWFSQPDGSQRWCVDRESWPGSGANML